MKALTIAAIVAAAAGGLLLVGWLWGIMRDGRKKQDEYDKAWKIKKAELERAGEPWPPMPGRGEGA